MGKLFKNVRPYWKLVLVIMALLIVQAFCDLSLPQYTSDMIDTGIQNSGIRHILPEKITKEDFEYARMFMTKEEAKTFSEAYSVEGDIYSLNVEKESELDALDKELIIPIVLTYNMSGMEEAQFKAMVSQTLIGNPGTAEMAGQIENMTLSDVEKLMQMDFDTFEAEDENGIK